MEGNFCIDPGVYELPILPSDIYPLFYDSIHWLDGLGADAFNNNCSQHDTPIVDSALSSTATIPHVPSTEIGNQAPSVPISFPLSKVSSNPPIASDGASRPQPRGGGQNTQETCGRKGKERLEGHPKQVFWRD